MIGLIANVVVNEDRQAEFEAVMGELVASVHANEPGVPFYRLCKLQSDPRAYRIVEFYDDQAAFDAHLATDWFKAAAARFGEFFAENPVVERLNLVA